METTLPHTSHILVPPTPMGVAAAMTAWCKKSTNNVVRHLAARRTIEVEAPEGRLENAHFAQSLAKVYGGLSESERELAVQDAIKSREFITADLTEKQIQTISGEMNYLIANTRRSSVKGPKMAFEVIACKKIINSQVNTTFVNANAALVHSFPDAHFIFTDSHDQVMLAESACNCSSRPCKVMSKAFDESRLVTVPPEGHTVIIMNEWALQMKDKHALFCNYKNCIYYSIVYYEPNVYFTEVMDKPLGLHYSLRDRTVVIKDTNAGRSVFVPLNKFKQLREALIMPELALERSTVLSYRSGHMTRFEPTTANVVSNWLPESADWVYFIPNFLNDSVICIPREALDNVLRRLMATEATPESIWKTINTSSMSVTLSGIELAGKIRNGFDDLVGVWAFLTTYIPMIKSSGSQASSQHTGYTGVASKLLAASGVTNSVLSSSSILSKAKRFWDDMSGYETLASISARTRVRIFGADQQHLSLYQQLVQWYNWSGTLKLHARLYGKNFVDVTAVAELCRLVWTNLLDRVAMAAVKLSSIASFSVKSIAVLLVYFHEYWVVDDVLCEWIVTWILDQVKTFISLREVCLEIILISVACGKTFSPRPLLERLKQVDTRATRELGLLARAIKHAIPIEHKQAVIEEMLQIGVSDAEYKEAAQLLADDTNKVKPTLKVIGQGDAIPLMFEGSDRIKALSQSSTGDWDYTPVDVQTREVYPTFKDPDTPWLPTEATIPLASIHLAPMLSKALDNHDFPRNRVRLDADGELQSFMRELHFSDATFVAAYADRVNNLFTRRGETCFNVDCLVTGLYMSAKSQGVRAMLDERDLVVVPTKALRDDWEAAFADVHADKRPKILTQHVAFGTGGGFRIVVIDEVYTLATIHVALLGALGRMVIHVGDKSQIPAVFAPGKLQAPMDDKYFNYRAKFFLPVTYGPADSLAIAEATTLNTLGYTGPVFFACTTLRSMKAIHLSDLPKNVPVISFTQMGKGILFATHPHVISVHESQGSRFDELYVLFTPGEATFARAHKHHLLVAATRARRATYWVVTSMADIKTIPSYVDGVNGGVPVCNMPYVASVFGNSYDEEYEKLDTMVESHMEFELPNLPTHRVHEKPIAVILPPFGGKTTLARQYPDALDVDDVIPRHLVFKQKWDKINRTIQREITLRRPQIVFAHHPAQVGDTCVEKLMLITPWLPQDSERLAAYDMNVVSLRTCGAEPFLGSRSQLANKVRMFFYSNVEVIAPQPLHKPLTILAMHGEDDAIVESIDITPVPPMGRVTKVNIDALVNKPTLVRGHDTSPLVVGVPAEMTRGRSNPTPHTALSNTQLKRIRSMFNRKLKPVPTTNYSKLGQKYKKIMATLEPTAQDAVSYCFTKGGAPKKTTDLLKFQGVFAQKPAIQAVFAGFISMLTLWVQVNLRSNIVLDLGLTEEELAARVQQLAGKAPHGIQEFDLEKQDTSHSWVHVQAFQYIASLAQVSPWFHTLFEQCRTQEVIKSLDGVFTMVSHEALGSGAAWTLLSNCLMALTSLALDTDFDPRTDYICQKGDDGMVSRVLTFAKDRQCPLVKFKLRVGTMASFCSRIFGGICVRMLGRKVHDMLHANPKVPEFYDRVLSWGVVYSEIQTIGIETYALAMYYGFDHPVDAAINMVNNYCEAFEYTLSLLQQHAAFMKRAKAKRVIVSTKRFCFFNAVAAFGPAYADQVVDMQRDNVDSLDAEKRLIACKLNYQRIRSTHKPSLVNLFTQQQPDFRGVLLFHDHAVAITDREIMLPVKY